MTVPTNNEEREALGEVLALVDDYDGCHERVRQWEATEQWKKDAYPEDEPFTDREDAEGWNRRADAALAWFAARRAPVSGDNAEARNKWNDAVQAERQRQRDKGYDASHDAQHGVDHLLMEAQEYARRGESVKSAALIEAARELLLSASQPHAVSGDNALRDAFAELLGDVYTCSRVWEAWGYKTMTQDDFAPASESEELLDDLVTAALSASQPRDVEAVEVTVENSPTLAVHAEAARFGYVLSSVEAAYVAEAAIAASGLREEPREAAPSDTDREALAALRDLFNAGRGQWHSDSCRADLDAAMQALSDDRGRFDESRFSRTSHPVQVTEAHRAVREFLQSALAESDADERDPDGGSGWDVEVSARTVLRLLDSAPAQPVQVEVNAPQYEVIEVEMGRHEPVLSMSDGHIAGCQCMDRVFHKKSEDWASHLADASLAALSAALGGGK